MRLPARQLIALAPLLLTLAACAPKPIYQAGPNTLAVPASEVSRAPERYAGRSVIWGGRIVAVTNFADHSEIEILAYPLDGSQRPKADDNGSGRFIALLNGFVEPLNYPAGALITISGQLNGSRAGKVGEADYVFPLVSATQSHVWTRDELASHRPNFSFGLGVGVVR